MSNKLPSPKVLDTQSKVKIDRWVDINSEECSNLDPDAKLARDWIKKYVGDFLFTDTDGRIWGESDNGYYPFHFEVGKRLYGYRISKSASN